jgi:hypothetical protein
VPFGQSTDLKLKLPLARQQQLAEVEPEEEGAAEPEEDEEEMDDVDVAKRQVREAREKVVEDAKRLQDISQAIAEEQHKAKSAEYPPLSLSLSPARPCPEVVANASGHDAVGR